ncbi:MAG: bifunctional folylpolyglutamate synthase/dihydrofolate synthase [Ruminococcaceae bacterium]|nr:bifunctional folylpolyglutamate synthase/dihydrofolate synthase [Oscillospiraceae bacterium]
MTYEEAINYIHSIDWRGSRPGLSRVTELLDKLGNPQDGLKFIHVGGTNGKGSFCAMMASVLKESGLKTGLFTSPYIEFFNERMMINGEPISDDELAELTSQVREFADSMIDPPTEFELITALAMLYFKKNDCDIVVLEVGLGGRLDATNIIKDPILSVVTGIALEHTAILGNTVKEIAAEKAGIIKKGRPVLLGCASADSDQADVEDVVVNKANECGSAFYKTDISYLTLKSTTIDGTVIDYKDHKDIKVPLLGLYQPKNAANVLSALDILRELGYNIGKQAISDGIAKTLWKARFERISESPLIFFDGSHNPQGITEAVRSINQYFGEKKVIIVTGVMADKNYLEMVNMISSVASEVFTLTPDNPRALSADKLADVYNASGIKATASSSVTEAVSKAFKRAQETGDPIFALGSLYMYSEVKNAVITAKNKES